MTDRSGVIKFVTHGTRKHFKGAIVFQGVSFDYNILFTPLNKGTKGYDYVVDNIGKRVRDGKSCLGIDEATIRGYLDRKTTSAYGFVNETGTDDEASGAIQIYNWCSHEESTFSNSQMWIGDLCRLSPSQYKSYVSPTKVLLFLFEQLTAHNTPMRNIHLMIDEDEREPLEHIYGAYGFEMMAGCDSGRNPGLLKMAKRIVVDAEYENFPFAPLGTVSSKKARH
jgi:hypothetical protein